MLYVITAIIGYLIGSIPTGYLVGRMHGIDIREHGSGNIGATNVLRVLGKKPGIFVFVCDALKGFFAAWFFRPSVQVTANPSSSPDPVEAGLSSALSHAFADSIRADLQWLPVVAAFACILGHNFPIWLKFRGGKGIATTAGVLLGLMPLAVAISGVIWAAVFFTLRYVSVASLVAAAALPVTVGMLWRAGRADAALFLFSLVAAALAFWRHRSNIQRLIAGIEPRFTKKKSRAEVQRPTEEEGEKQKLENS